MLAQHARAGEAANKQDEPIREDDALEDLGNDVLTPRNLLQVYGQFQQSPASNGGVNTTDTLNFRGVARVPLSASWTIGLRADAPLVDKTPAGAPTDTGLGDVDAQLAIIHDIDSRTRWGAGLRIVAPSGGETLGTGKWQALPGAAFRYAFEIAGRESYFEPELLYDFSFAGDPSARTIGNWQFSPTVNVALDAAWFATLYPSQDIRWNCSAPVPGQTGRLFLPFDASLGRRIGANSNLALEIGVPIVKAYPVYDFKSKLTLNVKF